MKNGENKSLALGSGPLGGSSWRSIMEEKLYIWSLQSGGHGGPNGMWQFQSKIYT